MLKNRKTSAQPLFRPKKKLGQNFIFGQKILEELLQSYQKVADSKTVIIEVGSGYGTLTRVLAEETACYKVISLEKDPQLFELLLKTDHSRKITFLCQDVLEVDWPSFCLPYAQHYRLMVAGNLPYFLANTLLARLFLHYKLFKSFLFLVQKEVALRWTAKKDSPYYSSFSVINDFMARSELVSVISREEFVPIPEVDGALVKITLKEDLEIPQELLKKFWIFVRNCFRFPRKTLLNNLLSFAGNYSSHWKDYFLAEGYSLKIRPSFLDSQEFWKLFLFWKNLIVSFGLAKGKKS